MSTEGIPCFKSRLRRTSLYNGASPCTPAPSQLPSPLAKQYPKQALPLAESFMLNLQGPPCASTQTCWWQSPELPFKPPLMGRLFPFGRASRPRRAASWPLGRWKGRQGAEDMLQWEEVWMSRCTWAADPPFLEASLGAFRWVASPGNVV